MNEKHTPGILLVSEPENEHDTWLVLCSAPYKVAYVTQRYKNGGRDKEQEQANGRRIVACWNACEGISTEALEDNHPVKRLAQQYSEVVEQRDALLDALTKIEQWNEHPSSYGIDHGSNGLREFYRKIVRDAISAIQSE